MKTLRLLANGEHKLVDENLFRMNLPKMNIGEIATCKLQGFESLRSCWDIFTGPEKLWLGAGTMNSSSVHDTSGSSQWRRGYGDVAKERPNR